MKTTIPAGHLKIIDTYIFVLKSQKESEKGGRKIIKIHIKIGHICI